MVDTERQLGQVKWFNRQTGWGFITILDSNTDNDDIFVHWRSLRIDNEQFKYLVAGEYVINLSVNGILKQTSNLSSMSIGPQQQMDSLLEWAPVVAGDYLFTGTPAGVAQLLVGDELIATLETTDGKIISQIVTICQ